MRSKFTYFALCFAIGCDDSASKFGSTTNPPPAKQAESVVKTPEPPPVVPKTAAPVTTPAPAITETPTVTPNVTATPAQACSRAGTVNLDVSVPFHWDIGVKLYEPKSPDRYYGDLLESPVARIETSSIRGDKLPVSAFELDDIAMIVKEESSAAAAYNWDQQRNTRTIVVPKEAILIYDGNNPNAFAAGSVNSGTNTLYKMPNGVDVMLPGGQAKTLAEVRNGGLALVAHNNISLDDLRTRGFVKDNKIVFKVFSVSHGGGGVKLTFKLEPCGN